MDPLRSDKTADRPLISVCNNNTRVFSIDDSQNEKELRNSVSSVMNNLCVCVQLNVYKKKCLCIYVCFQYWHWIASNFFSLMDLLFLKSSLQ